ncbi:hypothetical protein ACI28F_003419 [Escherichia coli]|uniref:Uncharacterized protein n=2 Tax=Escherichia coli TaxID=562 RepID=A0AAF0HQW4_ECOLX|nr:MULTISPECIES: hypothetical protein [Bacteria]MCU8582925.1 hypothetical protein [Klebsiella pneumoniae]MED6440381.1 hypothetical protein [Escherichia coli O157]MBZ5863101.1 hypothetical protein [Escherichia coli]MBZ5881331.1 hypothetical protein [Escherichia coli]MBZ6034412.1 hypothetical protein [Escherichia coli]
MIAYADRRPDKVFTLIR